LEVIQKTIKDTTYSIRTRVDSGEVLLGIICYKKSLYPECGTKGWILDIISKILSITKISFIDDSKVNIKCVERLNNNKIETYFVNKRKEP